jgi:hypothetical protein
MSGDNGNEGEWVTVEVQRALYIDRGRTVIVCDRNIVGSEGGTLLLKLKPQVGLQRASVPGAKI